MAETPVRERVRLTRVVIDNFRSIAHCDVPMGSINFLIGQNGAGKSNFIDALRFCRDCLLMSVDQAFSERRSNFQRIVHQPQSGESFFSIRLLFQLGSDEGYYSFRIARDPNGGYRIEAESCRIGQHHFERVHVNVEASFSSPPSVSADRLFLARASGLEPFRAIHDALSSMEFYQPDTHNIRLDTGDTGSESRPEPDCDNLAIIFDQLSNLSKQSAIERLKVIVAGLEDVSVSSWDDGRRFLRFRFSTATFVANAPCDGDSGRRITAGCTRRNNAADRIRGTGDRCSPGRGRSSGRGYQ